MKRWWNSIFAMYRNLVLSDLEGKSIQSKVVFILIAVISAYMSFANYLSHEYKLMIITLMFALLMISNLALSCINKNLLVFAKWLGAIEYMALIIFFIVSGIPDGFSSIWVALAPQIVMIMYDRLDAVVICACSFAILVFFFWTEFGRSLLQYEYDTTYLLRFPIFDLTCFFMSFFLMYTESIQKDEINSMRVSLNNIVQEQSNELRNKMIPQYHYLKVKSEYKVRVMCIERIMYIDMIDHYIYYHMLDDTEPIKSGYCRTTFKKGISEVTDIEPAVCVCGVTLAVNLKMIKHFDKGNVILINNETVFLSRQAYCDLYDAWSSFYSDGKNNDNN